MLANLKLTKIVLGGTLMFQKIMVAMLFLSFVFLSSCGTKKHAYNEAYTHYIFKQMRQLSKAQTMVFVYRDDSLNSIERPVNCFLDEKFVGILEDNTFLIVPTRFGKHMIYCGVNIPSHGSAYSKFRIFSVNGRRAFYIKISQGGIIVPSLKIKFKKRLPSDFFEDYQLSKGCVFCLKYTR